MTAPNQIVAGDTLDFLVTVADYPPADGWTLKIGLVPRFTTPTQAAITLTAITSGTDYRVQAGPSTTANWKPGAYSWMSWVEKTGARQTLEGTQYRGELTVEADVATRAQGYDGRSWAQKALDDARAAYATYKQSNGTVAEYQIGERRMKFSTGGEILAEISALEIAVDREMAAEDRRAGRPDRRKTYLRMQRA